MYSVVTALHSLSLHSSPRKTPRGSCETGVLVLLMTDQTRRIQGEPDSQVFNQPSSVPSVRGRRQGPAATLNWQAPQHSNCCQPPLLLMSRAPTWSTQVDNQPQPRKWLYVAVPVTIFCATFSYASWWITADRSVSDRMPGAHGAHHGRHTLRSEQGLLYLNSSANARHPIPELLAQSNRLWEDKLAKQSRTLREAVTEYERRYSQHPFIFNGEWQPETVSHSSFFHRTQTSNWV